jgi:hypothetical protein
MFSTISVRCLEFGTPKTTVDLQVFIIHHTIKKNIIDDDDDDDGK